MTRKRTNAYSQLIQEGSRQTERPAATSTESETPESGDTAVPQSGKTVEDRKTVKNGKTAKITIYPTQEQLDKLYDLMEAFRRKTGVKINQQDMIRRLIDLADENTVLP